MNRLKTLFIILAMMFSASSMVAEQPNQSQTTPQNIVLKKKNNGGHIKTPKAPGIQVITCDYDGEGMQFNFVIPEGICTLTVTDEGHLEQIYSFDSTELDIYIPVCPLSASISVILETELGNCYEGVIE